MVIEVLLGLLVVVFAVGIFAFMVKGK